jgi:hypothetical protein
MWAVLFDPYHAYSEITAPNEAIFCWRPSLETAILPARSPKTVMRDRANHKARR